MIGFFQIERFETSDKQWQIKTIERGTLWNDLHSVFHGDLNQRHFHPINRQARHSVLYTAILIINSNQLPLLLPYPRGRTIHLMGFLADGADNPISTLSKSLAFIFDPFSRTMTLSRPSRIESNKNGVMSYSLLINRRSIDSPPFYTYPFSKVSLFII